MGGKLERENCMNWKILMSVALGLAAFTGPARAATAPEAWVAVCECNELIDGLFVPDQQCANGEGDSEALARARAYGSCTRIYTPARREASLGQCIFQRDGVLTDNRTRLNCN